MVGIFRTLLEYVFEVGELNHTIAYHSTVDLDPSSKRNITKGGDVTTRDVELVLQVDEDGDMLLPSQEELDDMPSDTRKRLLRVYIQFQYGAYLLIFNGNGY